MENPRKYGSPPFTVAVVHGGPGAPGEMAGVARELSSVAGVLEPLQAATTINEQVTELCAILGANGSLPMVLIGFSWGAWLSCLLADAYPQCVRKLILISSGPFKEKYAAGVMETRLARLQDEERKEARSLYAALSDSVLTDKDRFARFG